MTSPPALSVGQKVRHPDFGEGVVRGFGGDGVVAKVHFDSVGGVVPAHASVLTPVTPDGLPASSRPSPIASTITSAPDMRRLTVECLRQGLPPPGRLTSWTIGHAAARQAIDTAIADAARGKGAVLFARAGYGQGKSHIGRLGRELALEQGLASFHVELDGKGLSLGAGTRLVAALFASALLPEARGDQEHTIPGLATVLKRAAPFLATGLPPQLQIFSTFLRNPQRWSESDEVIEALEEYLSGHRNKDLSQATLQGLLGTTIALESLKMDWGGLAARRRRQAEQLGRVVQLARVAGAKGAFVVIDELDHDYQSPSQSDFDKKNQMLRELARLTDNSPVVLLLLARELEWDGPGEIVLGAFTEPELSQLVEKTIDAFAAAHPSPALAKGRKELFGALVRRYRAEYQKAGWGPRFFVRATVECCEATRSQRLESLAQVSV